MTLSAGARGRERADMSRCVYDVVKVQTVSAVFSERTLSRILNNAGSKGRSWRRRQPLPCPHGPWM